MIYPTTRENQWKGNIVLKKKKKYLFLTTRAAKKGIFVSLGKHRMTWQKWCAAQTTNDQNIDLSLRHHVCDTDWQNEKANDKDHFDVSYAYLISVSDNITIL
jgi:hypothetical protein